MQKEVLQKVRDVPEQRNTVRATTDSVRYTNFMQKHFVECSWLDDFHTSIQQLKLDKTSPDFFRLSTFNAMQVAQYGFAQMEGQTLRHNRKKWEKLSVEPRHQLANAIYMARLNLQAHDIKQEYSKKVNDQELSFGVWGLDLTAEDGTVKPTYFILESVLYEARNRIQNDPRPIVLPDPEINAGLAAVNFTGDDADTYTDEQFEEIILPQVEPIVHELFDARTVFTAYKNSSTKKV